MRDLEEQLPYFQRLRDEYESQIKEIMEARKRLNEKNLSAEEIYSNIEKALQQSPVKRDQIKDSTTAAPRVGGSSLPQAIVSPRDDYKVVLSAIPVDENRRLEIRVDPRYREGEFEYAAVRQKEKTGKDIFRNSSTPYPPDIPKKIDEDIANLRVSKNGHVSFVRSSYTGAKEGAVERLMLEAAKRDMTPHSSNLLGPGKNMVEKFGKTFSKVSKQEYLDKIRNFLKTGKAGKIWSTAAPIVKPVATGLGVLGALTAPDVASAAADIAIPGGVSGLGVDEDQKELDKKYTQKLREMSKRNKK